MAERHFSQHVPFGKNPRDSKLAVDHRNRSHMMVQHLMNGVGYGGFQTHRGNLPITKVQHTHKYLLRPVPSTDSHHKMGLWHYAHASADVKKIETNIVFDPQTGIGARVIFSRRPTLWAPLV